MTQEHASINGALLRLRREARGWVQSDVATRACMSVKQIRQLEDGGLSAFYSEAVKVTAAKKVGHLLGLTEDEVFSHGQPEVANAASSISPEADLAALLAATHDASTDEHHQDHASSHHDTLEALHGHDFVSEPATSQTHEEPTPQPEPSVAPVLKTPSAPDEQSTSAQEEPVGSTNAKSKSSLGLIIVLFVGAIVLAALFRPEQEVPALTEPPPPLQPALQSEPPAEGVKEGAAPAAAPVNAASAGTAPAGSPAGGVTPMNTPAAPTAPAAGATATPATPAAVNAPAAPAKTN